MTIAISFLEILGLVFLAPIALMAGIVALPVVLAAIATVIGVITIFVVWVITKVEEWQWNRKHREK